MGKHLWKKQSIRVEKDGPGCIWTVFRLLNYHPWQNVKRMLMLPYINQKSRKKRAKMINEQIEFSKVEELEEDTLTNYSVNSSPSGTGSSSKKKSIRNRIKALLAYSVSNCGKENSIQEHELLALKDVCTDLAAPTLISLLKANPKLLTAINPADESANLSHAASVKHSELMEEYVGVFELFKVDQDMFLKILQDSPRKKHRLVKSGSFPFSNAPSRNSVTFGKTPKKLEHKLNEVWPILNQQGYDLRKSRSQNIGRSSSLKESLDRYGPLIYATSNNKNGVPQATIESAVHNIRECDEARLVRVDSCRERDCLDCTQTSVESNNVLRSGSFGTEQGENIHQVDISELTDDHDCETNKGISSVSAIDMHSQQEETENLEHCPIIEDKIDSNESLQYVKFVLDIIGFTTTYGQLGAQHTLDDPLDPALFDDIEIFFPFESNPSSKKEIVMSPSQRKILFDLLNEALLEINENYAYYPKPLTSSCVVHPVRKVDNWVVEQVWEFISEYLLWKPETDEDFDSVIVHELSRHQSGWSNLQRDTEVLAVDLEDWIFDELLGEIVCCQVTV